MFCNATLVMKSPPIPESELKLASVTVLIGAAVSTVTPAPANARVCWLPAASAWRTKMASAA